MPGNRGPFKESGLKERAAGSHRRFLTRAVTYIIRLRAGEMDGRGQVGRPGRWS